MPKIGHVVSQETRDKISKSLKGRKFLPDSHYEKLSIMFTGEGNPNYGKSMSDEQKEAVSKSQTGRKHTEEHNQKISDNNARYWKGKKHSEQSIQKMKEKRVYQKQPMKDTKPEKMMQTALTIENIKFETHKPILGQPDIFIEPNICIFVDGDFWHGNPELYDADKILIGTRKVSDVWARDLMINHELNKLGYQVIRIWASDIMNTSPDSAKHIITLIKSAIRMAN